MATFATAYPAPWRIIQKAEVVDRDGRGITHFEVEREGEIDFWRGIVSCVNAVAEVAGDSWLEGAICHSDAGGQIGEPAALDLLRRLERVRDAFGSTDPVVDGVAAALQHLPVTTAGTMLEDRLAECLAACVDTPLLTVRDTLNDCPVDLRLGSFNRAIAERAAELLEEAGR